MEGLVNAPGYWAGKTTLVTGATGLVGAWLCASLVEQGARVVALVRDADPQSHLFRSATDRRLTIVNGDLASFETVERAAVEHSADTIFHLGAQAIVAVGDELPLLTFESNIRGTYNVLESARRHPALVRRVVVASSDKAYGTHESLPYTEDMALIGRRPYEVSKSCADLLATCYFETYRLPVAIARCGNVYGGGDLNWSRLVPDTVRSTLLRRPVTLRSDGTYVRDYVYVKDVVSAYETLARALDDERLHGEAFNFSPERPYTVLEVVATVLELMDARELEPVVRGTARGEIVSQYLDATKARERLGWSAGYSLRAGLAETIAWYREFLGQASLGLQAGVG